MSTRPSVTRRPRERMRPPDPKTMEGKHILVTKKTSLKKIFRSVEEEETEDLQEAQNRLEDAEQRTNNIMYHATHFLKLYLVYLCNINRFFPDIDEQFLRVCMRVGSNDPPDLNDGRWTEKNKETIRQLMPVYNEHYLPLLGGDPANKRVSIHKLKDILGYEETDLLKNIKNNVVMHFTDYCKELFNKKFDLKGRLRAIDNREDLSKQEKKSTKTRISTEFRIAKKDFLSPLRTPLRCNEEFRPWILANKMLLIGRYSFLENNIEYDIKVHPLEYLQKMFYVCERLNEYNSFHHPIPLRTSSSPCYITIDSLGLANLMIDEGIADTRKRIKSLKHQLWNQYFKLDLKEFRRKDYLFHHMIKTDGVGVSIIFHRQDQNPDRLNSDPPSLSAETRYVDDVRPDMNHFRVVGIDPGKEDLLHCTDGERFYRYTANQRRKQTKQKKYEYILNGIKYYSQDYGYTNEYSVTEFERGLSVFNKYTCHFDNFKNYIRAKTEVLTRAKEFYNIPFLRKLRWNSYINTQCSESKMINQIKKHFGTPDRVIIAIGDWSHGKHHMRGKEPTKGKGFRKLFKQAGYQTYLVHEYNTSKICHRCFNETSKFRYQPSKKPKTLGQNILVHGLLRCNSVQECGRLWNRDVNGSLNILLLANEALRGHGRPIAFRRDISISGSSPV
jgi:transposase